MLKKILLPVLAALVIACAAGAYLFTTFSARETAPTTVITAVENSGACVIRFTDPDGKPVSGVMCNVCDDTSCTMLTSDEDGIALFTGEFKPSKVQLLKVPEGFALPSEANFPLDEAGAETVIKLEKN